LRLQKKYQKKQQGKHQTKKHRGAGVILSIITKILILGFLISCDFSPRLQKEILIAQDYLARQEVQKAIGKYEEILKVDCPDDIKTKIYFQLGELYSTHLFDNLKAIKYFRQVIEVTSDPKWLYMSEEKIAEIKFSFLGKYKEAKAGYQKLIKFQPRLKKHDFYEYRLGLCDTYLMNHDIAKQRFEIISNSASHEYKVQAFYELGHIYFKEKQWQKALDYWSQYILQETRKDNIVHTKYLMANCYETMEQLEEAYNLYYSIFGDYPNTKVLQNRLNAIYERRVARKR